MIKRIKQFFCNHKFKRTHTGGGCIVCVCNKCEKVNIEFEWDNKGE